jgi:alanine racemase
MSALAVAPAPTTSAHLTVDLAAVAANTRLLASRSASLMAVVKADGFGHGAVTVARVALANGASWLGVTSVEEALALRSAGLTAPLLSWLNPVDADFVGAIAQYVDVAVPSLEHLTAVARAGATTRRTPLVHLYADCGLARDGSPAALWPALCRQARRLEARGHIRVVGLMGHLPSADSGDNTDGRSEFEGALAVARAAGLRPEVRHLAATSATLTDPSCRYDLSRVGAGLYGIDPTGTTALAGALTLTAPVVTVRQVDAGQGVGYGHTWTAPTATGLAQLPIGYADGIPRGSHGEVQLLGRRCPVVGRISMDQLVVDTGSLPVRPGDTATVFGPGEAGEPTVAEWARWSGTIAHEIVTGLGTRVRP